MQVTHFVVSEFGGNSFEAAGEVLVIQGFATFGVEK